MIICEKEHNPHYIRLLQDISHVIFLMTNRKQSVSPLQVRARYQIEVSDRIEAIQEEQRQNNKDQIREQRKFCNNQKGKEENHSWTMFAQNKYR